MGTPSKKVLQAATTAMMDITIDVPVPSRARAFSFSSQLADMAVGDAPACKVMPFYPEDAAKGYSFADVVSEAKGTLRNNIASSVTAARRRVDASYKIETGVLTLDTGMYVIGLVHRVE